MGNLFSPAGLCPHPGQWPEESLSLGRRAQRSPDQGVCPSPESLLAVPAGRWGGGRGTGQQLAVGNGVRSSEIG